ncbi:MAG: alpha-glucosidase C-terminal domain-containing protein [Segetibacter sp.]
MIAFRNSSNAIRRGNMISCSTADICAFTKQLNNEKVLVIANLRNKPIKYKVPSAFAKSSWKNALNGGNVAIRGDVTLQPYSYLVLKNK